MFENVVSLTHCEVDDGETVCAYVCAEVIRFSCDASVLREAHAELGSWIVVTGTIPLAVNGVSKLGDDVMVWVSVCVCLHCLINVVLICIIFLLLVFPSLRLNFGMLRCQL